MDGVHSTQRTPSRCTSSCKSLSKIYRRIQTDERNAHPQLLRQGQVSTRCHRRRRQAIRQEREQPALPLRRPESDSLPSQLLNRNPKHRLGATRDAAELKEHAFFSSIDWDALAARQIPPPFKPYVDSDESVANFDPEFTEANLLEEAPDDVNFDEDDPSADWLDQARRPLNVDASGPMQIKARRPPLQTVPLSTSVQENFRAPTSPLFLLHWHPKANLDLLPRRLHIQRRREHDPPGGRTSKHESSRRFDNGRLTTLSPAQQSS